MTLAAALAVDTPSAEAVRAKPAFSARANDSLVPGFSWSTKTYAARCSGGELSLRVRGARGWRSRIDRGRWKFGGFRVKVKLGEGQAVRLTFRRSPHGAARHYHIRCLPADFPAFQFERVRKGGPGLFMVAMNEGYATIFTRNGAPVWWQQDEVQTGDAKVLPDGTISWNSGSLAIFGPFEIRDLAGRLLRTIGSDSTDLHDLQLLPNGNYLIGSLEYRRGVNLSEFGGPSDGIAQDIEIQELTPGGRIVSRWDSAEHLGFDEVGRWSDEVFGAYEGAWYDTSHWNAVEPDGKFMYLSFRNLDAIYKVNRNTGRIVWKLGGTETPESLKVLGYPRNDYPLGGQHDVRVQPNGTITLFNNRTGLADPTPRAQRFRINEVAGTARLIETVEDKKMAPAFCCGSARRMSSGDWLISWGSNSFVGAYNSAGNKIFRLQMSGYEFTYRANEVPAGAVSMADLRRAMNRMNR